MMRGTLFVSTILLGACSSFVPGTFLQVSQIDPLTADPADIALRTTLPDSFGMLPGSGTLALSARQRDGSERAGRFPVELVGDVLQVAPDAQDELRALQAAIAAWEAADPDGTEGSLSVDLEPCRRGAAIAADAPFSISIRLEAGGEFLPLVRDAQVSDLLENETVAEMKPCP